MAAAFDEILDASFAELRFPASRISVHGGLEDHVHKYPHSPGGAPEKLGRKLYEFDFTVPFSSTFRRYPKLWPDTLQALRKLFEAETTAALVVPTIGTIQAYCIDWPEEADPRVSRSGVTSTLKFREDASDQFLTNTLIFPSAAGIASAAVNWKSAYELEGLGNIGIFTQIYAAAARVTAILDQGELAADLLSAQVEGLVSLCQQADEHTDVLNAPTHVRVLQSLHRLWRVSQKLNADALRLSIPIQTVVLPAQMTITDASRLIYGDNSRAMELLRLNAIADPFSIAAGTPIRAYAA